MGKQSRRKRDRDEGLHAANAYFRRVGLPTRPEGGAYRRLAVADPEWSRRFSETEDATPARYALLYRDLDTALAEYGARPVAIAHPWLRWWSEHHPPATRLLDVGCGPGVLTCAYALALPDAEVVGVDAVPEAVACAEELARRICAGNASFVVADFTAPVSRPPGGEFDQLVAVTALGDGGVYPSELPNGADPFSSVAEVDGPGQEFTTPAIPALAGRLAPGGSFLAFDRTPYAAQAVRLGAALLHGGVDLDLARAGTEEVMEDGRAATFTRLAGTRSDTPETSTTELAEWLKGVKPPAYGTVWHDELRFEKLKATGAELVWGAEITYAPYSPAVERREVWARPGETYGWVTTSLHLRQLSRAPSVAAIVAEYTAYIRERAASGARVRLYAGGNQPGM
ncbi:MAG: class I SAM-dependent methyltransferase [Acidimicrobiia bacterium]